jgi:hypothetical protein
MKAFDKTPINKIWEEMRNKRYPETEPVGGPY